MRSSRRAFLAAAVGAATATSGCVGFLLGEESLSFAATPVDVADDALAATGFERLRTEPVTLSRTFEVAGQSRTVELTNYVSEYAKSVEVEGQSVRGAVFGALATPVFEVAGQSIDPVDGVPADRLARRAQDVYGDVRVEERLGTVTRAVLGSPRDILRYALAAAVGGTTLDVLLQLGRINDAGDALVLAGLTPRALDAETRNVLRLASALTHASG